MNNPDEMESRAGGTSEGEDAGPALSSSGSADPTVPKPSDDHGFEIEANSASATEGTPGSKEPTRQTDSAGVPLGNAEATPDGKGRELEPGAPAAGPGYWFRGLLLLGSFFVAMLVAGTVAPGGGVEFLGATAALFFIIPIMFVGFPAGLPVFFERLFTPAARNQEGSDGNLPLGCLIYTVVGLTGLLVRDRRWFWSVFVLWLLLLLANISGCRPVFLKSVEGAFGASQRPGQKR